MTTNRWHPELDKELLHKRNVLQESTAKIANEFGFSETTVRRHLRALSCEKVPQVRHPSKKSPYKPQFRECRICEICYLKNDKESYHNFIRRRTCYNPACIEADKLAGDRGKPRQLMPWPKDVWFEDITTVEKPDYSRLPVPANSNYSSMMGTAAELCTTASAYRKIS